MSKSSTVRVERRRFTLLDGMILIGAIAAGLGGLRALNPEPFFAGGINPDVTRWPWSWERAGVLLIALARDAAPPALAVSLAALAIRLRGPRPRWRRVARQPGLVAGLVIAGAWAIAGAFSAGWILWNPPTFFTPTGSFPLSVDPGFWLRTMADNGSALAGFAVAVAWSTQALVGRWRPEPTWPDRLGRLVGVGWLLMGAVAALALVMQMG